MERGNTLFALVRYLARVMIERDKLENDRYMIKISPTLQSRATPSHSSLPATKLVIE